MQQSLVLKRAVLRRQHQYLWIDIEINVELSLRSEQKKIPCKILKMRIRRPHAEDCLRTLMHCNVSFSRIIFLISLTVLSFIAPYSILRFPSLPSSYSHASFSSFVSTYIQRFFSFYLLQIFCPASILMTFDYRERAVRQGIQNMRLIIKSTWSHSISIQYIAVVRIFSWRYHYYLQTYSPPPN